MKWMALVLTFALGSTAIASEFCPSAEDYEAQGWVVHNPEDFAKLEKTFDAMLSAGQKNGQIIDDMSGHMVTGDLDNKEIMLAVKSYEDLRTPDMVMYGDHATYTHMETQKRVEIRWFNGKKNLVINPKYIKCITGQPPVAENVIL
ncbi:hypothetical protein DOM22_17990 [Bdellovibrio sp. ZAP7]|uniref:hypothetical protein n=1 Tax=Bdellovibrio sp. ZAP7 TaxID=2231053 RepID=UPI00115C409B|nr:hypothetical protein [Bdellovibrio sp. ZAP7]QDK46911.1 hypothetical protein DOM22_17990 [Bdellovibrio sp. ZAP7]